jgi:hypothetical protein
MSDDYSHTLRCRDYEGKIARFVVVPRHPSFPLQNFWIEGPHGKSGKEAYIISHAGEVIDIAMTSEKALASARKEAVDYIKENSHTSSKYFKDYTEDKENGKLVEIIRD